MKSKVITFTEDTVQMSVDLDFGNHNQFREDFLNVIKKSESDVPCTILELSDIENDRKIVRFSIYYPSNKSTQTTEHLAT